jgi:hypothetical protein
VLAYAWKAGNADPYALLKGLVVAVVGLGLILLYRGLRKLDPGRRAAVDALLALAPLALVGILGVELLRGARGAEKLRADPSRNLSQAAYEYLRRHPGAAYFPNQPLAHVLAEGRLYHFLGSVYERRVAGYPLTPEHLRRHIPPSIHAICYNPPDQGTYHYGMVAHFFPDFCRPAALPALPQFVCVAQAEEPGAAPQTAVAGHAPTQPSHTR